jgi:hypothetical protein
LFFKSWLFCAITLSCSSNFWPSCVATMHFSSIHDPLTLLCCVTS